MIQTYRCRRCGFVLEATVEFVPGLPLAMTQQAMQNRVEAARLRHADRCPGLRPQKDITTRPEPEPRRSRRPSLAALLRRRAVG